MRLIDFLLAVLYRLSRAAIKTSYRKQKVENEKAIKILSNTKT